MKMVTELFSKDIVSSHRGVQKYVYISGTVDGRQLRTTSTNFTITDEEAKTLLETMVGA